MNGGMFQPTDHGHVPGCVPEGGEDWGRHLRSGVQGKEQTDRPAGGSEEDPSGFVSV